MPTEGLGWDLSGLGHILCAGHSSIVVFRMRVSMLWSGPGLPSPARAGWSQQQQSRACTIPVPAAAAWIWWVCGQWPEEHKVPAQGYQELEVSAPQGHSAGTCRACHGPCSSLKHPWCSPSHRQGCSREAIQRQTPSHSASTKTWGFYFSPLRPDLRLELLWKLRPGCAPQTPIPAGDPMGLPALPAQQAALRNIPARSRQIFLSSDWCH